MSENKNIEIVIRASGEKEKVVTTFAQKDFQNTFKSSSNSPYEKSYHKKSEIEKIVTTYDERILAMQDYNTRVVGEMTRAGMEQAQIEKSFTELKMSYIQKERDFRIQMASQSLGATANFMQNLYVLTGSQNKKMFSMMKAFSTAQALMDTYAGATRALSSLPFPANIAAMASVVAAGMAKVKQIRSTSPGGGSISAGGSANSTYRGGAFNSQPVPMRLEENSKKETQNIVIQIHNPISDGNWDAISEQMVEAINRAGKRNVNIDANVIKEN